MSEKITTWYIYPADAHSNEVVAQAMQGLQTTDTAKDYLCNDQKTRFLYRMPDHSYATRFMKSQKQLSADFKLFRSQGNSLPGEVNLEKMKRSKAKPTIASLKKASDAIKLAATMPKHRAH